MKKLLGLVVVVALAVTAAVAISAPQPKGDGVDGSGNNNPVVVANRAEFHFDGVRSAFDGSKPRGKVRFKTLADNAQEEGTVMCLNVSGNKAAMSVLWTKLTNQTDADPTEGAIVYIVANGKPVHGQSPDQIQTQGIQGAGNIPGPSNCPAPIDIVDHVLTHGNIHVKDNGVNHD